MKGLDSVINTNDLYKTLLKKYFWDSIKLFLPELYEDADRNVAPVPLDEELQKATSKYNLGQDASRVDLLMSVTLKNGKDKNLLCHLSVQGEGGEDLPSRMLSYNGAIFLQCGKGSVGIAVSTAPRPTGEKTSYMSNEYGCETTYEYKNFFVIDTADEILLSGENRIGLILYAAKCAYKSGKDETEKLRYLRHISDLLSERGWSIEEKRDILEAVECLIRSNDKI